jgi:hypothetical protein
MQPGDVNRVNETSNQNNGLTKQIAQLQDRFVSYFGNNVPNAFVIVSQVALAIVTLGVAVSGSGLSMVAGVGAIGLSGYLTANWIKGANKEWKSTFTLIETSVASHAVLYYASQAAILSNFASAIALMILGIYAFKIQQMYFNQ